MIRKFLASLFALALIAVGVSKADWDFTQGSGTTAFSFTCFTTKNCFASVPITSAGTNMFVLGTPGVTSAVGAGVTAVTGTVTTSATGAALVNVGNSITTSASGATLIVAGTLSTSATGASVVLSSSTGASFHITSGIGAKLVNVGNTVTTSGTGAQLVTFSSAGGISTSATGSTVVSATGSQVVSATGALAVLSSSTGAAFRITSGVGARLVNVGNTVTTSASGATLIAAGTLTTSPTGVYAVRGIGLSDASTSSGQTFSKVGANAVSIPPVYATSQTNPMTLDLAGRLITIPYANPEYTVQGTTAAMTGTTSTQILAAPAAGYRNYVTTIICGNSSTVPTNVAVVDGAGTGSATIMTIPAATSYGGAAITMPVPLRQPTTATSLVVANVTTGSSVICTAIGFKSAL